MNPDKMSSTKTEAEIAAMNAFPTFPEGGMVQLAFARGYAAGQESRWIPVSERKPEHIRHIAMLFPGDRVVTGGYLPTFDTWMDDGQGELEKPTHWFYIPEAPKH